MEKDKKPSFPWKKNYIKSDELIERFKNLINYEPNYIHTDYTIRNMLSIPRDYLIFNYSTYHNRTLLLQNSEDYVKMNELSDYWIEPIRVLARKNGGMSLYQFWNENHEKYKGLSIKEQREKVYKDIGVEVGTFRPSCAVAIIKLFESKRVLDFSSGWGDRLIGALASNVELYTGVDPQSSLRSKYCDISNFFRKKFDIKTKVNLITSRFETCNIKENYDLILTSPPYFDLEIYSDDTNQSIYDRSLESWKNDFLYFSLRKAWEHLDYKGHMVIVINDYYKEDQKVEYVKDMIDYVNEDLSSACYLGCIAYSDSKQYGQPMWIWEKFESKRVKLTIKHHRSNGTNYTIKLLNISIEQQSSTVIVVKHSKIRYRFDPSNPQELLNNFTLGKELIRCILDRLLNDTKVPESIELLTFSEELNTREKLVYEGKTIKLALKSEYDDYNNALNSN